MLDNKSIKKLDKSLNPNSFRFIMILYDNSNDIMRVKEYIAKQYPRDSSLSLDIKEKGYSDIASLIYSNRNKFIFIDDFYTFFKQKITYSSFNQRRDKIAKYNINLICFYPKAIQEQLYRDALYHIPDLWEFRTAIIELKEDKDTKNTLENIQEKDMSSLGGTTAQSKKLELVKIEERLKKSTSKELQGNLLSQLGVLNLELSQYEQALAYLEKSLAISVEIGDKSGEGTTLNNISQIYKARGDLTKALEYLEKSLKIRVEIGDKSGEGATLNNISAIYHARGDLTKALEYLEKSLKIYVEIGDKSGEGVTLFNIGHIYLAHDEVSEAVTRWVETYKIAKEIENAQLIDALENLAKYFEIENTINGWEALKI